MHVPVLDIYKSVSGPKRVVDKGTADCGVFIDVSGVIFYVHQTGCGLESPLVARN